MSIIVEWCRKLVKKLLTKSSEIKTVSQRLVSHGMKKGLENTRESSEVWKPIRGLENYFAVSSHGNVKSIRTGTILKSRLTRGYLYIVLLVNAGEFHFRRNIPIHRLVAQEFCDNRLERKEVNHKDGNKLNNHASNLEWISRSENIRHSYAIGLRPSPNGNRKHSDDKIMKVFELRKMNLRHKEIAEKLGMGTSTVTHILLGSRRNKTSIKKHPYKTT